MNIQRTGVNLLIVAEAFLLIVVLVVGILSGAAGVIRSDTEGTEDNKVSENTERENWTKNESDSESETELESESETETATEEEWVVPESYVEQRIVFSTSVEEKLAQMSLEQKVAQLFVVTPEAVTGYNQVTVFGNASKAALNEYPVGGVVYSSWNYQSDAQMQELITNAQSYYAATYGMMLFTMTRDGQVNPITAEIDDAAEADYNVVFTEGTAPATQEGYYTIVVAGTDIIILDNALAVEVTGEETTPCCLSNRLVGMLRESMGYEGVLITDNLSEESFVTSYGRAEACVTAIQAGVDMLYMPVDFVNGYNAVLQAVRNGDISMDRLDNAVGRILTAKGI